MRTASELEWLRVREHLRVHRHPLGISAADGYPSAARLAGTPLLTAPEWIPAAPLPLDAITLSLSSDPGQFPAGEAGGGSVPYREDGSRYGRYSQAIRELDAPAIFENRTLYRLVSADLAGPAPRLGFGAGRYFDALDIGTAAAHEYAARQHQATEHRATEHRADDGQRRQHLAAGQPLREAIGDPCDLSARPVMMAVATLTLRVDRDAGTATFPLHYRDPLKVGHAGGMYQVLPAGIFQPSGEAEWNVGNDFSLWRGMVREYAEELLGVPEDHDSERGPIDYAAWPFAGRMTACREAGLIRTWCVGLGVDPLTFATDLLTVAAFDAPVYDELFGDLVGVNAEGTVIAARPFDPTTVAALIADYPLQAAGAALLALAIEHADALLA